MMTVIASLALYALPVIAFSETPFGSCVGKSFNIIRDFPSRGRPDRFEMNRSGLIILNLASSRLVP